MAVERIPATKKLKKNSLNGNGQKLRVAAYCRVSTDSDEQGTSYEAQCQYYTDYIHRNEEWELVGIYADEGISGTQAKSRPEFQHMIADCKAGKIDYIITKSISRWARNTLDSIRYIRELKQLGIPVVFEKENINTMDSKGEVLITIMSSIAQQESQSISQNVRMGIQYQMQQGKSWVNTTRFMGFTSGMSPDQLLIVPEEAKIVRRIFREYLDGYSPAMIAKHLEKDGIRTKTGGSKWHPSTIMRMLQNEKYAGDTLLQKYYTEDFLTHKIVKNTGQLPQYYVRNHHEPIVPREIFRQVQEEMKRRAALKNEPVKLRYGSENALQGRLICGCCGNTLKEYERVDGTSPEWRCRTRRYIKKTGIERTYSCNCRHVPDGEVKEAILEAFRKLPEYRAEIREKTSQRNDNRMLLELLDVIAEKGSMNRLITNDNGEACYSAGEFFKMTRYRLPEGIVDEDGSIREFEDEVIIRYMDHVGIYDDEYRVCFKAGISINIRI